MTDKPKPENPDTGDEGAEQTFLGHLVELRDRLLRAVLAVVVVFAGLFAFSNELYALLARPLLQYLPEGHSMIATGVISPFLTPFKLTLVVSVFLAMPYVLYQIWAFVAPGLYQHEKRLARPLLVSSIVLFYLGMVFCYYVVFPLLFRFMAGQASDLGIIDYTPDITAYLDTVLKLLFAFGVAFEVPVATIILIATGVTDAASLAAKRPYIIVGAFVVGMLLTPPDVISQTLLALPMWGLFELGLVMSRLLLNKREEGAVPVPAAEGGAAATAGAATGAAAGSAAGRYEDDEFVELSDEEMEAELERAMKEEAEVTGEPLEEGESGEDEDDEEDPDPPADGHEDAAEWEDDEPPPAKS